MEDYAVDLPIFHGPLDLLLYLVKRDELDLLDIPIARVAGQFLHYLDVLQAIDVEQAGDFLVMAATLMELKSKMLLPRSEEADQTQDDPRQELVRQLLEYRRFKEAATLLEQQAEKQASRLPRTPPPEPAPSAPAPLRTVELWDLVSAFGRLLRETLALQPQQITVDQTPLQFYMDELMSQLQSGERQLFSSLFSPPCTRARLVGYFLAILELTRRFRLQAEQETIGDIWIRLLHPTEEASQGRPPPDDAAPSGTGVPTSPG